MLRNAFYIFRIMQSYVSKYTSTINAEPFSYTNGLSIIVVKETHIACSSLYVFALSLLLSGVMKCVLIVKIPFRMGYDDYI